MENKELEGHHHKGASMPGSQEKVAKGRQVEQLTTKST